MSLLRWARQGLRDRATVVFSAVLWAVAFAIAWRWPVAAVGGLAGLAGLVGVAAWFWKQRQR